MTAVIVILAMIAPTIDGPASFREHSLGSYTVKDVPAGAGISWRVPRELSYRKVGRDSLTLTGPPGTYTIEALIITTKDGNVEIDELSREISIAARVPPSKDPMPPPPDKGKDGPPSGKAPAADPWNALGRIQMRSLGCTATVIGPRRADGKWDVLCAAHCVPTAARAATMKLREGKQFTLTLVEIDRKADLSWFVTDAQHDALPFALLAREAPPVGTRIWHGGYGVDRPGNREAGSVVGAINSSGQLPMRLSVSSGDSGGGIFREDTGELVASVCCTMERGALAPVWGGACVRARELRKATGGVSATPPGSFRWTPLEMPLRGAH